MAKLIGILGGLLLLSACSSADNSQTTNGPTQDELGLAVNWGQDGYGEGFIVKPVPGATGDFRLRLYYRDPFSNSSTGVVNRCFGHWNTQTADANAGQPGSGGGDWQINCASGRRAEGTFDFDQAGNGSGEGFDQEGNRIQMVFRPEGAASNQ